MIDDIKARLLLIDVLEWKKRYIAKQKKKYPDITNVVLIKKIKKAKAQRFGKESFEILQDYNNKRR